MNKLFNGALLVALASSCYGLLTTFVKLAYEEGFTTYEVSFAQILIGFVVLVILNLFIKNPKRPKTTQLAKTKSIFYLILSGTSLGFTSVFYYLAVQTVSVSVGIVLLMQGVWLGVVADSLINRIKPSLRKVIAVILILIGTVLAADLLMQDQQVSTIGILYGFLAAISYTITMFTSNSVALEYHAITRSKWMMLGGLIIVGIYTLYNFNGDFDFRIFKIWGPILALFGTVLPPLLFTAGMPKINVGLGAILSSVELPVAVLMGYFVLHEAQNYIKWLGILLILFAIVLMNYKKAAKVKS